LYRMTVLYGHPRDPEAFDRYYREVHIPIARRMRGLTGWTIGHVAASDGGACPYYMAATLYAESREAMDAVLASPEGRAAADDVANFATGGVTYLVNDEEVIVPLVLEED
jgi:uncharacterized protein (TIGR02118 family)